MSKISEKLIKIRIVHNIENAVFWHDAQFSFRENRSTESAILAAVSHVRDEKAKWTYPVLVALDIQGAFDNIEWRYIIDSLQCSPVDKELMPLIRSYLSNRKVSFFHQNDLQLFYVSKDCPQGPVLGPLFCNLVAERS